MKKLILASGSPRRRELLTEYGFSYQVVKSEFSESLCNSPCQTAKNNALGKARDVFFKLKDKNAVVLGADTIVVFGNEILGKPKDDEDAFNTLKKLNGKTHKVITAYAFCFDGGEIVKTESSSVEFNNLSDADIKSYVATGSPLDKAGAYGVQDSANIVKKVEGSINNVIGLSIEVFEKELKNLLN